MDEEERKRRRAIANRKYRLKAKGVVAGKRAKRKYRATVKGRRSIQRSNAKRTTNKVTKKEITNE